MRTFYIISETEMKEVGMKPPNELDYQMGARDASGEVYDMTHPIYWDDWKKWQKHLAAAPIFQHRLNKKGLVSEEDFVWGWYVKTESYQGEGHHVFKTEKEAIEKYNEWSQWNGNLQAFTHKPVKVAIPKEEKEERTFTEKVLCAAIWYKDLPTMQLLPTNIKEGVVVCGHRHGHCINTVSVLAGLRTVKFGENAVGETEQGFLTTKNRFISRTEAKKLAKQQGQDINGDNYDELFSEDLY